MCLGVCMSVHVSVSVGVGVGVGVGVNVGVGVSVSVSISVLNDGDLLHGSATASAKSIGSHHTILSTSQTAAW